jgi:hypothetical protein
MNIKKWLGRTNNINPVHVFPDDTITLMYTDEYGHTSEIISQERITEEYIIDEARVFLCEVDSKEGFGRVFLGRKVK